ncbi:MAG: hypothetical protein ACI9W2_001351 [Gammaproteobacteria bacterium]|jgi:hypothetical protein
MKLFTEHPATVGETYGKHFAHAGGFGVQMLLGGCACLLHAVLPFTCLTTGSKIITHLHDRMVINRASSPAPAVATSTTGPRV